MRSTQWTTQPEHKEQSVILIDEIKTPVNRTKVLICGMLAMLSLGTPYFWSIFQFYLVDTMGWTSAAASMPFSIVMTFFPFGSVLGGRMADKMGPKAVLRIMGAGVLGICMMLCSVAVGIGPMALYVVFVVMALGSGAAYNCVLPSIQMWFPDRRGFAMGCVVGCAGAAGLVFSPYAEFWLNRVGARGAFLAVGIAYVVIIMVASIHFDRPPVGWLPEGYTPLPAREGTDDLTTSEMLKTGTFFLLASGMLASVLAYLMISPQIKSLVVERGMSQTIATATVMLCGLANAGGRLCGSWASDKLGLRQVIMIAQVTTVAGMIALSFAGGISVSALCFLVAFCYGTYLAVFPSLTSSLFGLKYAGGNYGCVLMATVASALLAPAVVSVLTKMGEATLPFFAGAAVSILAASLMFLLGKDKRAKA